jgi:hypothetical protein
MAGNRRTARKTCLFLLRASLKVYFSPMEPNLT